MNKKYYLRKEQNCKLKISFTNVPFRNVKPEVSYKNIIIRRLNDRMA
jgi:hypothetical protein